MTIDEAIAHEKELAKKSYMQGMLCHANPDDGKLDGYIESGKYHEQIAEWLEKLEYIENIILKWNADYYNDENTGIPDDEILEAIFNACTNNGFDIPIDEDFREGYNKAIDDFVKIVICELKNRYTDMPIVDIFGSREKWKDNNLQYLECENLVYKIAKKLKEKK